MIRWLFILLAISAAYSLECPKECECTENSQAKCPSLNIDSNNTVITHLKIENPRAPIHLSTTSFQKLIELTIEYGTIDFIDSVAFISNFGHLKTLNIRHSNFNVEIPPKLFKHIRNVNMSFSNLKNFYGISSQALHHLSLEGCKLTKFVQKDCPNLAALNLKNNSLTEFILNDPIAELDLSWNRINKFIVNTTVEIHDEYDPVSFDLSHNPIKTFETKSFYIEDLNLESCDLNDAEFLRNISQVYRLNLRDNNIKAFSDGLFLNLDLKRIDLSANLLLNMPDNLINESPNLHVLKLDENIIETIQMPISKDRLPFRLRVLSCDNCNIKYLKEDAFEPFMLLEEIILTNNHLKELPKSLFYSLEYLKKLDLGSNLLGSLDADAFSRNFHLKHMNLAENKLTNVPAKLFKETTNLESLDISNCNIVNLWPGDKTTKLNLIKLNAENNKIEKVTLDELNVMGKIQVLNLNNNPLKCEGKMFGDMYKWLKTNKVNVGAEKGKHNATQTWMDLCPIDDYTDDDYDDHYEYDMYDSNNDNNNADTMLHDDNDNSDAESSDNEEDFKILQEDVEDVAAIDPKINRDYPEQGASSEFVFFLLPTLVFVLTALIVLILTVSVILCILQKKNKCRSNAPQIKIIPPWTTNLKNKKHSGLVYKPLSEEKFPV